MGRWSDQRQLASVGRRRQGLESSRWQSRESFWCERSSGSREGRDDGQRVWMVERSWAQDGFVCVMKISMMWGYVRGVSL
mmetsp:Transcript_16267/g.18816  ORF Transcript_16267/g.18816 Transcript_16267/m.18816 type:complete len:80 (+) Transcript_16267:107-346(+)